MVNLYRIHELKLAPGWTVSGMGMTMDELIDFFDVLRLMQRGRKLGNADAMQLEREMVVTPDLAKRLQLLAYYATQDRSCSARMEHLAWLIANWPHFKLWMDFPVRPDDVNDELTANFDKAWKDQVGRHEGDVEVLLNAAWFLREIAPCSSESFLKKIQEIEPDNFLAATELARMKYEQANLFTESPDEEKARACLDQARLALSRYDSSLDNARSCPKNLILIPAIECAIFLGLFAEAEFLAQQLSQQKNYKCLASAYFGDIAIALGNSDKALEMLRNQAANNFGSPPELRLARKLLLLGHKSDVCKFLEQHLQTEFNDPYVLSKLKEWIELLRRGCTPNLEW